MPVLGEVRLERARELELREPEARRGVGSEDQSRRAGLESELVADLAGGERRVLAAQLDDPVIGVQATRRRREPQLKGSPIAQFRRERRRKRGRRVDDEQIARGEEARKLAEAAVRDSAVRTIGDQQTNRVASLRRPIGL